MRLTKTTKRDGTLGIRAWNIRALGLTNPHFLSLIYTSFDGSIRTTVISVPPLQAKLPKPGGPHSSGTAELKEKEPVMERGRIVRAAAIGLALIGLPASGYATTFKAAQN